MIEVKPLELQTIIEGFQADFPLLSQLAGLSVLLILCFLADVVTRRLFLRGVRGAVRKSENKWDDVLVDVSFFQRLAHVAPALVIYFGAALFDFHPTLLVVIHRVAVALLILFAARTISAFLDAVQRVYAYVSDEGRRPIKGYLSFLRIGIYLVTGLLILSVLMDRSPWIFLSGIGAMTAVLMLVFKDTLLSLVASVQITSNNLIRVGDWIEMPQYQADGDVIDVALHTVKVQNWDKTITTVPTHAFITSAFKNWRGMSESESRRIKRSLHIDISSIRFLGDEELERISRFSLLKDYMAEKHREIQTFNAEPGRDREISADIRRLTNVGTLRAYMLSYLRNHPSIHRDRTLLVRQLSPGPEGLPIEIYCFTNDIVWANYEDIQSDIFDHFLAIAPEFGLRIFQQPAGADLSSLRA
jgi:miniconductance mechanosensitive channel